MSRTLAGLVLLLTAAAAAAQERQPGEPIPLTVSPAAAATPALKYRLLPGGQDLVPGNAAVQYYRSLAVFSENRTLLDELNAGHWDTWLKMPLTELPLDQVAGKLGMFAPLLAGLEEAARRRDCDWQLADRPDGIFLLLPELQKCRMVARIIAVRARYRLARGHGADAVAALATGYALGRNLARGPTMLHVLVGVAVVQVMDSVLEELIQQPGAPNLYWALTVLPRPYFDPQLGIDQEATMLERTWPVLGHLEEAPLTPNQVQELKESFRRFYREAGFAEPTALDYVATTWEQARVYPEARKALLAEGLTAEQLDPMPPFQVVALHCLREFHRTYDDLAKWVHVAHFGREPGYEKARNQAHAAAIRLERLVLNPKGVLSTGGFLGAPALERVYATIARSDRRCDALRCVEAIRLYAATHGGQLPADLRALTDVPVPVDPITSRPFEYTVHGDRALLSAHLQDGDKTPPLERLSYDITLRH